MKLQFVGVIRNDNTIRLPALQRRALEFKPGMQVYVTLVKLPKADKAAEKIVRRDMEKD